MKKRKKVFLKKGFLLIEILIAIAILSIITSVAYICINTQIVKAKDAKIKNDLIEIRSAFDQYYDDTNCFPKELPECGKEFKLGKIVYLKNFPCLENNISYDYELTNKESKNKHAEEITCPQWYKILTDLKNLEDKSIDLIGCRNGCGKNCNYNFGISSTNISINEGCPQIVQYACTPSGFCQEYSDPIISNCPVIFKNDSTCQNKCSIKENRCQNEKGKKPNN